MTIAELVLEKLRALPPEKQHDVLHFVESLAADSSPGLPLRSLRGLWAGMGFDVTEEDIALARREMWGNFPREFS
jgi:hypothetical protein